MPHTEKFINGVFQLPGYHSRQRYLAFESDDWGSQRLGSNGALEAFRKNGLHTDDPFLKYDSMAGAKDLGHLFDVLSKHKDSEGNHPCITANTNVANPDYKSIGESGFQTYHYEPFTTTLARRYPGDNPFLLWKEGMRKKLFIPQFHGREHLNVTVWLKALQMEHRETHIAFEHHSYGLVTQTPFAGRRHYLAALDFLSPEELKQHGDILRDGLRLFRDLLGISPASFIAPQYTWSKAHEKMLFEAGISYIQGHRKRISPRGQGAAYRKTWRYTGKRNRWGQINLCRNCYYEPSLSEKDWVDSCMAEIKASYALRKPAIIGTHRLNFVGGSSNGKTGNNLRGLDILLTRILNTWPDVRFVSSDILGSILN